MRWAAWLALALAPALAQAEKWPLDAGRLDAVLYSGAVPDDGLDDGPAIQAALSKYTSRDSIVYLPCGIYDSSIALEWRTPAGAWTARVTLEGERPDCVRLRLMDGAAGFQSPAAPKSFVATGSFNNTGNEGFQNAIVDLTIDTGNNPGARALDFAGHNEATVRNVRIEGSGVAGLYLGRAYPGPLLIERVVVAGSFSRCIALAHQQYGVTLLDVETSGCAIGLDVAGNAVFAEGLRVSAPRPVTNATAGGYLVLVDGDLACTDPTRSAIELHAAAAHWLRAVRSSGCASALKLGSAVLPGPEITERTSAVFGSAPPLGLPSVRAPARFESQNFAADWASALAYGAGNGVGGERADDTAGIQAALASGKPIVYLPRRQNTSPPGDQGWYVISASLTIPKTVRRLLLAGNMLKIASAAFRQPGACVFRVDEGEASDPPLEIEYFRREGGQSVDPGRYFCVRARRQVVLRRLTAATVDASGPGDLFLLDGIANARLEGARRLWAWQLNIEGVGTAGAFSASGWGTLARVVGLKTERDFPHGVATDGAALELLGGFFMPCVGNAGAPVASTGFSASGAALSLSFMQYCGGPPNLAGTAFPVAVSQDGTDLPSSAAVNQGGTTGNRRTFPFYGGRP